MRWPCFSCQEPNPSLLGEGYGKRSSLLSVSWVPEETYLLNLKSWNVSVTWGTHVLNTYNLRSRSFSCQAPVFWYGGFKTIWTIYSLVLYWGIGWALIPGYATTISWLCEFIYTEIFFVLFFLYISLKIPQILYQVGDSSLWSFYLLLSLMCAPY